MELETQDLTRSLAREAAIVQGSIVLTPVDNFPPLTQFDGSLRWTHGLYASDKSRSSEELKETSIQFGGRRRISEELQKVHALFAERLGGETASLRLLSGLHAHVVLFMGLAEIGARVALLPVEGGGHFATPAILERLGLSVEYLPIDFERMCVDQAKSVERLTENPPDILFIDRSEGLKFEDFSSFCDLEIPLKIFDSSQYVTQIMFGLYDNPFSWGFDLQMFTLHKNFPGPQKAAVVGFEGTIWDAVKAAVGAYVSSSHIENTLSAGALLANTSQLETYAKRLVEVAECLERELHQRGVPVILREKVGEPAWHGAQHLWIRLQNKETAFAAWRKLERNRIQTNFRKLPYRLGWGLRLGVTAAVSRGLTSETAPALAELISEALSQLDSTRSVRQEVTRLAHAMLEHTPFSKGEG